MERGREVGVKWRKLYLNKNLKKKVVLPQWASSGERGSVMKMAKAMDSR